MWETPVPIPNTMVKTQAADGTALETVWESRWPPDQKKLNSDLISENFRDHMTVTAVRMYLENIIQKEIINSHLLLTRHLIKESKR